MANPRPRRKNKKPDERQEEILGAAEKLFRKKGFVDTTIADIIDAVGLSHGAIYHHFPNKRSILIGLGDARLKMVRARFRVWLEDDSLTPTQKVQLVVKQFNSDRNMRMAVDFIGFGFVREDPELHNAVVQLGLEPLSREFAKIIEQGVATGEFDVPDPLAAAVTINMMLASFIQHAGRTETIVKWPLLYDSLQISVLRMLGVKSASRKKEGVAESG